MLTKRAVAGLFFGWDTTADERLEVIGRIKGGRWWRKPGFLEPLQLGLHEARLVGGSIQLFDYSPVLSQNLNPDILVMQPAQNGDGCDGTELLRAPKIRRILT